MKLKHEILLVFSVLLVLLTLSIVTAIEDEIDYYQLNTNSKLEFTCRLDNAIPSASATYNISVTHRKSGEVLVNNNQTVALGQGTFEYPIVFNQSGIYKIKSYCYDGVYNYSSDENIMVNYYGEEVTQSQVLIYMLGLVFLAGFLLVLFFIVQALPSGDTFNDENEIIQVSQLKHLRGVLYSFMYAVFVSMIYILANVSLAYLNNLLLGNFFFTVFTIMFWAGIIALPVITIWLLYKMYRDGIKKRLLERGIELGGNL